MQIRRVIIAILLVLSVPTVVFGAAVKVKEGDRGETVVLIQEKLKANGCYEGKLDGTFDAKVTTGVKLFQKKNGLKNDGIVDDKTYQLLQKPLVNASLGQKASDGARKYLGVPYKFGGTTAKGFDCSGLVQRVFHEQGLIKTPRMADEQFKFGKAVQRNALQNGDVVFFTTYEKGASHCGVYIGNGKFIHASSSKGVMISALDDTYWKPRYLGARRFA